MVTSAEVQKMEKKFDERMGQMEKITVKNSKAIGELTTNLGTLTKSTQTVVDITNAGRALTKGLQWLSSVAVVIYFLYWLVLQVAGG